MAEDTESGSTRHMAYLENAKHVEMQTKEVVNYIRQH